MTPPVIERLDDVRMDEVRLRMPVGLHSFCLSSRRATARIHPDGRVEFRADPLWFTDYYRREGIE